MGTAAAIIAAIGAGVSANQQSKASQAQRKAQKIAQRRADLEATRARREQVREARIRRAEIISRSQAIGGAGSSSEAGAVGSTQSQLGSNLSFLDQTQNFSRQITRQNLAAARFQSRAATASAVSSAVSPFADFKGAATKARSIFQTGPQ